MTFDWTKWRRGPRTSCDLAVDVKLELVGGGVADPDRP
jgi:hypothetical protein